MRWIFLVIVIILLVAFLILIIRKKELPSLQSVSAVTAQDICSSTVSELTLRRLITRSGGQQVDLYDELLTLGASCNKAHKLVDKSGKEIVIFSRHDCNELQLPQEEVVRVRDNDNAQIADLSKSYRTIVLECPQIE